MNICYSVYELSYKQKESKAYSVAALCPRGMVKYSFLTHAQDCECVKWKVPQVKMECINISHIFICHDENHEA